MTISKLDRVSVPLPIAIDKLIVRNGEGQSSHVLDFCINYELWEIITLTLKNSLIYLHSYI